MRYVQISEAIFQDLMSAKSKLTDIQILIQEKEPPSKQRLIAAINRIIYSKRYKEGNKQ